MANNNEGLAHFGNLGCCAFAAAIVLGSLPSVPAFFGASHWYFASPQWQKATFTDAGGVKF